MQSPLDPTDPKSTNVASETLLIRHKRFSLLNATDNGILTSVHSSYPYGLAFTADRTLPYHARPPGENIQYPIIK